jgi:hypothetical protein
MLRRADCRCKVTQTYSYRSYLGGMLEENLCMVPQSTCNTRQVVPRFPRTHDTLEYGWDMCGKAGRHIERSKRNTTSIVTTNIFVILCLG